jgi:membrane dipeptidase
VETVSMLTEEFPGHVDIPRMRKGKVGGMFMSVWIPCEENVEFLNPDAVSLARLIQVDNKLKVRW